MEIKRVVPAVAESYERIFHESGVPNFCLDLSQALNGSEGLRKPRLERAIGVIYRPETELASHYFQAVLPKQFDEYVWFDETKAITPFETKTLENARHLSVWLMNELNRTSPIPDAAAVAARLMAEFAMRTGLCPGAQEQRRYLWTDAFAVCNFLELFQRTSDQQYRRCAEKLIDQVHSVLGQYRNDDARHRWISGLDDEGRRHHPTAAWSSWLSADRTDANNTSSSKGASQENPARRSSSLLAHERARSRQQREF